MPARPAIACAPRATSPFGFPPTTSTSSVCATSSARRAWTGCSRCCAQTAWPAWTLGLAILAIAIGLGWHVQRRRGFLTGAPASIAYWSDASGEYELYVRDIAANKERKVTSYGPGYRYRLFWSPDSKKVAFIDKAMQIKICDVTNGKTQDADKELTYFQDNLDQFVPSFVQGYGLIAVRRSFTARRPSGITTGPWMKPFDTHSRR